MKIAIFGAGLMGHALALVHALGGHTVSLTDNDPAVLEGSFRMMGTALATLRDGQEVDPSWTDARLAAAVTRHATVAETLRDAELVVEAITERPETKRSLYAEIDALAPMDAIIASNPSALDIFPLVPERRLARTLIAHWYSPPYLVDLCDIVGGANTDPAAIETVRRLVADMGKAPVVMQKFIPGYIANRVHGAICLEVTMLLDEGYASPRDIDDAIIHGRALRLPVLGHLAKADFMVLWLLQDGMRNGTYQPPVPRPRSETLDALMDEGRSGVMAGRGYFDWGGRASDELFRDRDRRLLALKRVLREIGTMRGA